VQYAVGLALDSTGRHDAALAHYERAARLEPDNEVDAISYQAEIVSATEWEASPEGRAPLPPADGPPPAEVSTNSPDPVTPEADDSDRPKTSGHSVDSVQSVDGTEAADCAGNADPAVDADATSISASALIQKGAQAIAAGSVEEGRVCFWEAAALKPDDPQIPISAAVSSLRHNQPEVAIELLEPAVVAFPDSAALQRILGTAYYRRGDYKSSQLALQQALSLDKSSALSYFLLGCTLVKLGQSEAAETCFRQARVIDPRYATRR